MGTKALMFANFLLILQITFGFGTQLQGWNVNGNDRQEVNNKMFETMQRDGQENGDLAAQNFFNPSDDNEERIKPFPIPTEPFAGNSVEDYFRGYGQENGDHASQNSSNAGNDDETGITPFPIHKEPFAGNSVEDYFRGYGQENGDHASQNSLNAANDNKIRIMPFPTPKEPFAGTSVEDYFRGYGHESGEQAYQNTFNTANDNVIRITPFTTQKEPFAGTSAEDYFRGSPVNQAFVDRRGSPKLRPLETNNIEKYPKSSLIRGSSSPSIEKNKIEGKVNKEKAIVENKLFDSPELIQSSNDLVSSLSSSEGHPVVGPVVPRRINKKEKDIRSSLDRQVVMKLQRKIQETDEKNGAGAENQTTKKIETGRKPEVEEKQKIQEKPKVEEPKREDKQTGEEKPKDKETEKNQTARKNIGCDEKIMKNQAELENDKIDETQTVEDANRSKIGEDQESQSLGDKEHQKVLARIVVRIRSPQREDGRSEESYSVRSSPIMKNEIRLSRNPNLRHLFIRMIRTSSPIDNQKFYRPSFSAFTLDRNEDESSEYQDPTPLKKIKFQDHKSGFDNINGDLFGHIMLREVALLKAYKNMAMKQMAAFDAIGERHANEFPPISSFGKSLSSQPKSINEDSEFPTFNENMNSQFMPKEMVLLKPKYNSPYFYKIPKSSRVIMIRRENKPSTPLPTFNFPTESSQQPNSPPTSSRVTVIRWENKPSPPLHFPTKNSNGIPIFQQQQTDSESKNEPKVRIERVTEAHDKTSSNNFAQRQMNPSQDIPWLIKIIVSNMEQTGQNKQDGSKPQTPFDNPAKDENPALIRALLAPFAQ